MDVQLDLLGIICAQSLVQEQWSHHFYCCGRSQCQKSTILIDTPRVAGMRTRKCDRPHDPRPPVRYRKCFSFEKYRLVRNASTGISWSVIRRMSALGRVRYGINYPAARLYDRSRSPVIPFLRAGALRSGRRNCWCTL